MAGKREFFPTKEDAIAWILEEIERVLEQSDVPNFSNCLKIVARITNHYYAYYPRHQVSVITA